MGSVVARRPRFKIIQGDHTAASPWLDLPATIEAKSHIDPAQMCEYRVSREDIYKAAKALRRQPIFDFWSVIAGKAPPVPNISRYGIEANNGLVKLSAAHACFKGIHRPIAEDNNGDNVLAYILKPRFFYVYEANMVCVATKRDVPSDVVFVAYVRLDVPTWEEKSATAGVLTHWNFIESDNREPALPIKYTSRYNTRLW